MKDNNEELFPVVDEQGQVVGKASRGECHGGSMLLHPVVHLHVFNSQGALYLQKRPQWKDIQPGKWDTAVGGHIDYGETPEEALRREAREELGIVELNAEPMGKYVFQSTRERELVYVHRTVCDAPLLPSSTELDGGRFWSLTEILAAMGNDVLTPNFESEFRRFFLAEGLNLPRFAVKTKRTDNRPKLFDPLRRKYVALTPEEWVRQHFVHFLVHQKKYPAGLLANEVELHVGDKRLRADTLLYNKDLQPQMIIEYKAPHIALSQQVFDQVSAYNLLLHVDYLIVSNGLQHICCQMDYTNHTYRFLRDIPDYEQL